MSVLESVSMYTEHLYQDVSASNRQCVTGRWVIHGKARRSPQMARGVSSLKVELQCTECSDYYVLRKCESKWCCNFTFALFVE